MPTKNFQFLRSHRRTGRAVAAALIERLEERTLMSAASSEVAPVTPGDTTPVDIAAPLTRPSITTTSPASGATGILRDTFISAEVFIPNGGIDASTLTPQTVYLYQTGTSNRIQGLLNTSGGGDVIIFHPLSVLDADTRYTFVVTDGLKDVAGQSFQPYARAFTTGAGTSSADPSIAFDKVELPTTAGRQYLSVVVGPDDRLYAGTSDGNIVRWPINSDGTLGAEQVIDSIARSNAAPQFVEGLAFDPASTKDNPILWVTHTDAATTGGADWTGAVSKLTGANLENVRDVVIHLPRSARDHVTNQLVFGPDGAIYFCQASNSAMGHPDPVWDNRPEHLLNAAILRLDPSKLGNEPLDALTPDGGGSYSPYADGAPLTIYATGIRNAYDLVRHSNGQLYAPTNGSAAGGSTPEGPGVPGLPYVDQSETDYLFRIQPGKYYGHPNPARGEYVLNGGNPTANPDPFEVGQYPVGTRPDPNWQPAVFDFGPHQSPDGSIEYLGSAFGGKLNHTILVTRYSGGGDIVALTVAADGSIAGQSAGMTGMTELVNPVDLTEHLADGNLYVAEYGGERITLLRPVGGGGIDMGGGIDPSNGSGETPVLPTRTRADWQIVGKIYSFVAGHGLTAPDLTYLTRLGLKSELASLKDQARRNVLSARITGLATPRNYPLPNMSTYSLKQLKSLKHAVLKVRIPLP